MTNSRVIMDVCHICIPNLTTVPVLLALRPRLPDPVEAIVATLS
jgi:hypothetical protein